MSDISFLMTSFSVARTRSRLILALFEAGRGSKEFRYLWAEAWVSVLRRSPDGSKTGGTERSTISEVGLFAPSVASLSASSLPVVPL